MLDKNKKYRLENLNKEELKKLKKILKKEDSFFNNKKYTLRNFEIDAKQSLLAYNEFSLGWELYYKYYNGYLTDMKQILNTMLQDKNKYYDFSNLNNENMVKLLKELYQPESKYNFTYATLDLVRKNNGVLFFDKDLNGWNWTEYRKDKDVVKLLNFC